MKIAAVLGSIAALAVASSASAATIVNGGFENPGSTATEPYHTINAGDPFLTGWTVGSGGIDLISTYWTPSEGTYSIDLNALSAGTISQTFATIAGQAYKITFDMAGNVDQGFKHVNVDTGGSPTFYSFNTAGKSYSNMGWATKIYLFVATGSATTLTFSSADGSSAGPALDNITITTGVPEPTAWAMMLVGFGAIGAAMRSRRNATAAATA